MAKTTSSLYKAAVITIALLVVAAGVWQQVSNKEGLLVEAREVSGKPFKEHRVRAHTALKVEALDAFFKDAFARVNNGKIIRTVVEKSPERMVFYDRLKLPIGSDRFYGLEFERSLEQASQVLTWSFHLVDVPNAPACDGCVKMVDIHGQWMFSPAQSGGSDVTYTIYTDPGGGLPRFMVSGKQAEAARDRVRNVLKDAEGGR